MGAALRPPRVRAGGEGRARGGCDARLRLTGRWPSRSTAWTARPGAFARDARSELEPDEASFHLDLYRKADPGAAFDHFEAQRIANVELLRGLTDEAGKRLALHRVAGEITLVNMLHEWTLHDLGHVRQVAEIVRARKYLAGAGLCARSRAGALTREPPSYYLRSVMVTDPADVVMRNGTAHRPAALALPEVL